ncbi:MAG: cysteine desulfurase IscS [Candidatus Parcubacteria bacterium]|nr:MAG: cysteine desulfurase IscS [Candidatus Parcubacteria bacterium]
MKKIYLDFAATTFVRDEVLEAMMPYFQEKFGNPSSLHFFGQEALRGVDEAREKIKNILRAEFLREIVFTSSTTESNNLAIKGLAFYYYFGKKIKPHIITSSIEHPSVLEVCADLEDFDIAEISYLKPEKNSLINFEKIKTEIRENTCLVTIHYVNSELGTIQPIKQIAKLIQEINQQRKDPIYFHTDGAQAGFENLNVQELGVDLMTLSSHKIYGPKGVALLYVRKGVPLIRLFSGSEHEHELRAGTEAVPLIVGFAKAMELVENEKEKINAYLSEIRNYFIEKIKYFDGKIILNTIPEISSAKILNLYFPTRSSQDLLIYLDSKGIAVSAGTACKSRANEPSYIVSDIYGKERSKNSLRFSFGLTTTKEEIDYLFDCLKNFL